MRQTVPRSAVRPVRQVALLGFVRRRAIAVSMMLATLAVGSATSTNAQQPTTARATVTGIVRDAILGGPIPGAVVSIPNTPYQALTDSTGRYTLRNVPMGNQTFDARRIGYSQAHDVNVIVNRAEFTHDLTLSSVALSLAAVTTSATVDPTSGIKSPFAVSKITTENMPVPSTGVASNLIGKAAGVQVTRPSGSTNGDEPWIQFRSETSPSNRGSAPLIIVDGVPLNMVRQVNSGATVSSSGGNGVVVGAGDATAVRSSDIEGLDIESIELIKGAAAAALYGSQASGGVVSIKTKRGNDISLGRTQIQFRNEYGRDQIVNMPALRSHNYFLVNSQGQWINTAGALVPRTARVVNPTGFLDQDFAPGTLYNPIDQAFVPNQSMTSSARVSQNTPTGNFQIGYTLTRNPGEIRGADGATNQSARVNVDHQLRDNLNLSFGANFSRVRNLPTVANFATLFGFEPDINLLAPGTATNTKYVVSPDSNSLTTLNPLYSQSITGNSQKRTASQLSGNLAYRPYNWLTFTGNIGYNRQEELTQLYTPPGLPSDGAGNLTLGSLSYTQVQADGLDAFVSATALHDFGQLTTRFTGQLEETHRQMLNVQGTSGTFSSIGAISLNAGTVQTNTSFQTFANVNSGFGSIALDYAGKYIGDFLLRREGSSLFGPLSRWTNYGRASGAWLVSRESWWPLQSLTLAKLRYSIGIVGERARFQRPVRRRDAHDDRLRARPARQSVAQTRDENRTGIRRRFHLEESHLARRHVFASRDARRHRRSRGAERHRLQHVREKCRSRPRQLARGSPRGATLPAGQVPVDDDDQCRSVALERRHVRALVLQRDAGLRAHLPQRSADAVLGTAAHDEPRAAPAVAQRNAGRVGGRQQRLSRSGGHRQSLVRRRREETLGNDASPSTASRTTGAFLSRSGATARSHWPTSRSATLRRRSTSDLEIGSTTGRRRSTSSSPESWAARSTTGSSRRMSKASTRRSSIKAESPTA